MNIDCRVIGDLLPLYADESCSDASRALVDDHLKTCPRCRETLARKVTAMRVLFVKRRRPSQLSAKVCTSPAARLQTLSSTTGM